MEVTWVQILQVGGFAGIVSALIGAALKEWFEWRERRRKSRFLALQLSLILEDYYQKCVSRLDDIENWMNSGGAVGENALGLPNLPEYPSDPVAWVYLKPRIADEVLSLHASIRAIDEGIYFNINLDGDPFGPNPDYTLEHLYPMAIRAIGLARKVRSDHDLEPIDRTLASERQFSERYSSYLKLHGDKL